MWTSLSNYTLSDSKNKNVLFPSCLLRKSEDSVSGFVFLNLGAIVFQISHKGELDHPSVSADLKMYSSKINSGWRIMTSFYETRSSCSFIEFLWIYIFSFFQGEQDHPFFESLIYYFRDFFSCIKLLYRIIYQLFGVITSFSPKCILLDQGKSKFVFRIV